MPLLALDDTDTPHEGCTTHTAYRIAHAIQQATGDLDAWGLTAPARLVRLNPAAAHRTRGNGALVLPIGPRPAASATPTLRIGTWCDATEIQIPLNPPPAPTKTPPPVVRELTRLVAEHLPEPGHDGRDPQPAALLLDDPVPPLLYRLAVSQTVPLETAWRQAPGSNRRLTPAGRRGEIGALAAAAWPIGKAESMPGWTWEFTAYRADDAGRRQREVPTGLVDRLAGLPGGFDNLDAETGRVRAVPRTPCPVAFAARGTDPNALLEHLDRRTSHPTDPCGWLLLSNQATGDHARCATPRLAPHKIVRTPVQITGPARRSRGGHLLLAARTPKREDVTLAAFEPTKDLRRALEDTRPGDGLTVLARTNHAPYTLAVEAFRVDSPVPRYRLGPNPRCTKCRRATKSLGRSAGYRCPNCHTRYPEHARHRQALDPAPMTPGARFQVPDHVRGHLLPPLSGLAGALTLDGRGTAAIPGVLERIPYAARGPRIGDRATLKGHASPSAVSLPSSGSSSLPEGVSGSGFGSNAE